MKDVSATYVAVWAPLYNEI